MPAEQFVINIITTGDKEAVAAQGRVAASSKAMGDAAKGASAASGAAAASTAQKWQNAGATATAAGKKVTKGVTLPVLALGAVSGKMAVDFEKSMRNVNSIAQLPEPAFQRLNKQVLAMAGPTAQAPRTLAEGLYDLVSSGFDANESIEVLGASARAATAGLTTTEVSTKAVAAALNAYHRPATDAKQISDDLFQTVNLGVISFDELASTIGYVLPSAATMGINIKEVGASISTLTKAGQSGANAVTNINAAITSFIKPSKDMKGLLKDLGYETSQQLIDQKGFQGALEFVTKAVHGNKEAIGELFGNVRAQRAVFTLTGKGARTAGQDLLGFANDSGATAKVLKEQSKSTAYQWNQLKAEGSVLAIELGTKLVPVMKDVAHEVGGMVHWFTELPPEVQTTTIKVLAFGAAMGPLLRIGGAAVTMFGKLGGAIKTFAATDLAAGLMQGLKGDTAILRILGGDMAGKLVGGLSKAIPPAAAAAGIGNIVYSATQGDWEQAGFKGGGALIGGIIGAFGGPQGAMLGAGIGSFAGGLLGELFDDGGGNRQAAFRKRNEEVIQSAIAGRKHLVSSGRQVEQSERRLSRIGREQADVNDQVRAAQQRLNNARKDGETGRVRHEEARLNELKAKQIHLTHQQWREESLLHAAHVKTSDDARRARTVEVALVRTREAQLQQARKREAQTRRDFEQAVLQNKPLKEQNERERDLIAAQRRRKGASEKLQASEKELGGTMKEIADKFGAKFADSLRKQIPLWRDTAGQIRNGKKALGELAPTIKPLSQVIHRFGEQGSDATKKVQQGTRDLRRKAPADLKAVGRGYTELATTGTEGLEVIGTNTNAFLTSLKVQPLSFSLTNAPTGKRKGQARGGITRVPGQGRQDTVPLTGPGINAVVAPGEDVIVANRHQRPELDHAVRSTYGDSGLDGFFRRSSRPHYMAEGGIAKDGGAKGPSSSLGVQAAQEVLGKLGIENFPLPKVSGPEPLSTGAQASVNLVFEAAADYLRKHAGSPKVRKMISFAETEAAKGYPYVFGGGHGSFSGPYDCSGYVSAILHAGGFIDTPMTVAQGTGLYTLGVDGAGEQVTWGVRGSSGMGAHTMISLKDMEKGWRFFESGSGHGAAEVGGWSGSFGYRHFPKFAKGGKVDRDRLPPKGRQNYAKHGEEVFDPRSPYFVGWGLNQGGIVKRLASGGWAKTGYTIYSGGGQGAGGNLQSGKGFAELGTATESGEATGHGYAAQVLGLSGELPMGYALDVKIGSKEATLYKKDRGYGQGTSAYSIDIHSLAWGELGLSEANGKGTAFIRPGDGSAGGKDEHVPANFMGCKTKAIDLPSMPKTLHGIKRELTRRENELPRYRHAVAKAKKEGRPKLEQALAKNVTALESWIKQLKHERSLLRRKEAQRKFTKKQKRKLGKISAAEQDMELAERVYTEADQTAQQIVALEPLPRELGPTATDSQREKAEKEDVADFKAYVEKQEKPAYERVLDTLADYRNVTLTAEREAGRLETGFEKEVRQVDHEIDRINDFTEEVHKRERKWLHDHKGKGQKDYPDWLRQQLKQDREDRARLPTLRYRDRETRKTLGEARGSFYPGRENPISPPMPPIAGSGTVEEVLIGIQGTHWPDQHAPMKPLPGKREEGVFGGSIFDTQTVLAELDIKVNQAVNGLGAGGGGEEEGKAERLALVEEENRILLREKAISAAQAPVLQNYLGAYEKGGILPDTGFYLGHKGERVIPADQVGTGGHVILAPQINVSDELRPYISATVDHGFDQRGRNVGLSRGTPSVAGRRATMTQRRG